MCKVHFQGKQLCHICLSVGEYSKNYVTSLDVSAVAGHHAVPAALLFFFFLHCSYHCCCVCLACDSSIVATCPSIQLPALLFACVSFVLFFVVRSCFSGEPRQDYGRGLDDHKLVELVEAPPPPSNF